MSKASAVSGRAVATSCPVTSVSAVPLCTALLLAFTGTTVGAAQHAPPTEPVSTAAGGTQGDGASSAAVTTPNGRHVALRSPATNLVAEGPAHPGIYSSIRDLTTGEVTKIEQPLSTPRFSADGRRVAHQDSGTGDVWVVDPCRHRRRAGRRPRHRRADRGRRRHAPYRGPAERQRPRPGDGFGRRLLCTGPDQHSPGIRVAAVSPDGRRLLTRDADVNLPLHGRYGGREVPVGHGSATAGSLSAHGRSVVYSTVDAHVVPGDTNGMYDVIQRRSS
ncbi:hypothetical protein RKD27_000160 [Streptomyces sp. SAI-126]